MVLSRPLVVLKHLWAKGRPTEAFFHTSHVPGLLLLFSYTIRTHNQASWDSVNKLGTLSLNIAFRLLSFLPPDTQLAACPFLRHGAIPVSVNVQETVPSFDLFRITSVILYNITSPERTSTIRSTNIPVHMVPLPPLLPLVFPHCLISPHRMEASGRQGFLLFTTVSPAPLGCG